MTETRDGGGEILFFGGMFSYVTEYVIIYGQILDDRVRNVLSR